MALEQKLFHIIIEILAIIISTYFIYLSRKFSGWKKISLLTISIAVIAIDVYTLFSWAGLVDWFNQMLFHVITEALALPAGIILIYLSRQKDINKYESWLLLGMGIANILIDGALVFTWF